MGSTSILFLLLTSFIFAPTARNVPFNDGGELETYIVHVLPPVAVDAISASTGDRKSFYRSFLPPSTMSDSPDRLIHAYEHVASAFAARLTAEEVREMSRKPGFLRANKERTLQLMTTHTPTFLGMSTSVGFINGSNFGAGVIIGVLDTGILPNHTSFDGAGMPPPPSKWKGRCAFTGRTTCTNKLLGARNFLGPELPIDEEGHGTHTASTAAGKFVTQAAVLGNAEGTASGLAPWAYLAMYKVCDEDGCPSSAILAGMDAAVADGADVLSLSLGGPPLPFYEDDIAIGAMGAVSKGVFVSCAAGNSGPFPSSLSNEAPWILTVAASTMNRNVRSTVRLGNGQEIDGEALYQPAAFSGSGPYPLVFPGSNLSNPDAAFCGNMTLEGVNVKGKVVICAAHGEVRRVDKGAEVLRAGGVAMILVNQQLDGYTTLSDAHVLPASHISYSGSVSVFSYLNSTANPTATIVFKGTILDISPAPTVASFSSRGPSSASPGIMKPDITGPGVNVLAAWPFAVGPPSAVAHATWPPFNVISGTSMSTPHLSGIAALLKAAHPQWTPAMIKSAIMTSSDMWDHSGGPVLNEQRFPADFLAMGAGHVNPTNANDPGLVYDTSLGDYVPYLCGLGYTTNEVRSIVRFAADCGATTNITESDLNYPSISIVRTAGAAVTVWRTVTNVGDVEETYKAQVIGPSLGNVTVEPSTLQFNNAVKVASFTMTFGTSSAGNRSLTEGYLLWVSEKHTVRSPIVIMNE